MQSTYKHTNHVTMTLSNHRSGGPNYADADTVSEKSKKSFAKTSSLRQQESSDDEDERYVIDGP